MQTEDLDARFPIGQEVGVTWRGVPVRGTIRRIDAERANKDGSRGAVLVRVGDGHSQTSLFIPMSEVRMT